MKVIPSHSKDLVTDGRASLILRVGHRPITLCVLVWVKVPDSDLKTVCQSCLGVHQWGHLMSSEWDAYLLPALRSNHDEIVILAIQRLEIIPS